MDDPHVMQEGGRKVNEYMQEAEELLPRFKEEVIMVLAKAADPSGQVVTILTSIKGREVRVLAHVSRMHG